MLLVRCFKALLTFSLLLLLCSLVSFLMRISVSPPTPSSLSSLYTCSSTTWMASKVRRQ